MRIDFRDPDIPFSPTPSPTTSPDIFPQTFPQTFLPQTSPFFTGKGLKTYIYSCARISEHVQNILTNLLKVD